MPLYRRVPKKGFTNIFRTEYATVNVGQLEVFDNGTVVTAAMLKEAKIIRKTLDGVKVLATASSRRSSPWKPRSSPPRPRRRSRPSAGKPR